MDIRAAVVELVSKNDGQWSWYQLDRGLAAKGLSGGSELLSVIKSLVEDDFIKEMPGYSAGQPMYAITEKGKEFLRTMI
jgi:DNA-binding PadR family transcriptional regulator